MKSKAPKSVSEAENAPRKRYSNVLNLTKKEKELQLSGYMSI